MAAQKQGRTGLVPQVVQLAWGELAVRPGHVDETGWDLWQSLQLKDLRSLPAEGGPAALHSGHFEVLEARVGGMSRSVALCGVPSAVVWGVYVWCVVGVGRPILARRSV